MAPQPKRIAILGGGVGAMTAAFWLTSQPDWQQHYQIDVYQLGWRLGGKGASGRNAALGERIEEHGLHIWFGFYDNAFRVMRDAYAQLDRPPGSPLASWSEAFKPHSLVCLTEAIEDVWKVWSVYAPPLPGEPGTPREVGSIGDALGQVCEQWLSWMQQLDDASAPLLASAPEAHRLTLQAGALDAHASMRAVREQAGAGTLTREGALGQGLLDLLKGAQAVLHAIGALLAPHWSDALRRIYLCLDLGLAVAIGMIADDVIGQGFEAINGVDFYDWLTAQGAQYDSVHSAPVRGFYDLVFAYRDGAASQPEIEAGTMLRGMLKVALCYRGAIMYKMQAGMGDVVFAPLHELLERRGVRFHYFHKLLALRASADGRSVQEMDVQQQVALREGLDSYQPLVPVKGLPCWPSAPLYAQLDPAQADLLQRYDVNLECHWSDWPQRYAEHFGQPLPVKTLRCGEDFDQIVFGLSVASLPDVAADLLARSPALQQCSEQVGAVATQAYQVWTRLGLDGLGWQCDVSHGEEPVLSGYTEPFDTWASMNQLLCREDWPPSLAPQGVSYFCNAFPMADYPPPDQHDFPARCAEQVKRSAIAQLDQGMRPLWSKVSPAGFDWNWLVDPADGQGVARFDRQYWRVNLDPSERYVQSLVGSTQWRLHADESGFGNLFLAGDWLKTGLDAGCVEAAVMGGMQASRAICGWPQSIVGESGW